MSTTQEHIETPGSVLIGGLLTIVFGAGSVMAAIGLGWFAALLLGAALLVLAWKVPISDSALVLRFLMAGLGIVALLGAVVDLIS